MKNLFTLLLSASCLTAVGQTEYPYPYNPDGNNDGYISLNDLLDLLSVYGAEFNAGVLATDSISAIFYTGEMDYWDCASSCVGLKGNWKVLDKDLVGAYKSEIALNTPNSIAWLDASASIRSLGFGVLTGSWGGTDPAYKEVWECYCQTRTRADIEDINICEGLEDECGVCNGEGAIYECGCSDIPEGDCDCEGNQLDAIGVCGGDCLEDADGDGVCDPVLGPCEGQDVVTYHGYDYEIVETADGRCWFAENLRSSKLSNGDNISGEWTVNSNQGWDESIAFVPPAYFVFEGEYYYNGGVVLSSVNCCPTNWHVPSFSEWQNLSDAYAQSYIKLLELADSDGDYIGWLYPYESIGASGMDLKERILVGYPSPTWYQSTGTYHWTSTPWSTTNLSDYRFFFSGTNPSASRGDSMVRKGMSIRCIKDSE